MTIRTASAADIDAINRLFWELDADAIRFQPEHFQRGERSIAYLQGLIDDATSDFLLAIENDAVVGFSLVFEKASKGLSLLVPCRYAYIQDFVVAQGCRNRGIGSALMRSTKEWARERGMAYVRLSVFPQNVDAQRFYARHGLRAQMVSMECPI